MTLKARMDVISGGSLGLVGERDYSGVLRMLESKTLLIIIIY